MANQGHVSAIMRRRLMVIVLLLIVLVGLALVFIDVSDFGSTYDGADGPFREEYESSISVSQNNGSKPHEVTKILNFKRQFLQFSTSKPQRRPARIRTKGNKTIFLLITCDFYKVVINILHLYYHWVKYLGCYFWRPETIPLFG